MNLSNINEVLQHIQLCIEDGYDTELCEAVTILEMAGMDSGAAIDTVNWLNNYIDEQELTDYLTALEMVNHPIKEPAFSFIALYISPIEYMGFKFMISEMADGRFYLEYKAPLDLEMKKHYLSNQRQEAELEWLLEGHFLMESVINGEM